MEWKVGGVGVPGVPAFKELKLRKLIIREAHDSLRQVGILKRMGLGTLDGTSLLIPCGSLPQSLVLSPRAVISSVQAPGSRLAFNVVDFLDVKCWAQFMLKRYQLLLVSFVLVIFR